MPPIAPPPHRPDLRVARWLSTAFTAVLVSIGGCAIIDRRYVGYSSRTNAHIDVRGAAAVLLGLAFVALGLLPLAIWARGPRGAAIWGAACGTLMLALLVASRCAVGR